ncbi:MAG TPA: ABC transporter ATP-binding protein, partial [Anaerolineaceae bacterium]|nr:ABC transporter ATP-binding protein [Anaerolineaceae bacterium]
MKTLQRLNLILRPYRLQIALGAFVLIALTAIEMVFPSIIREVIDTGLKPGHGSFLLTAALVVAGLGLLRAIFSYFERYLTEWVANHIAFDLRNRLYNHIQRLSFSFHDHAQSGQLISRTIEDVRSLQSFSGHGISELLRVIMLLVGIVTIMFATNPDLAWIALLPMIPLVMITLGFGQRVGKLFLKVDNLIGELSSRLQENVTGAQVVRAFAREPHEIQRFEHVNRDLYKTQVGLVGEWAKIMPTTSFLVTLGTILILWFGGQMVLQGSLTLGELVA